MALWLATDDAPAEAWRRAGRAVMDRQDETEPPGSRLRLALHQPERPHNFGAALRLCACLGVRLDVVEPCGFPLDERRVRQGALDYFAHARWVRHMDFGGFDAARLAERRRLVLLSTKAEQPYHRAAYRPDDVLMLGSESAGVPELVHRRADLRVRIPLRPGLRSLNLVSAAAIVLAEALRQTGGFGKDAAG